MGEKAKSIACFGIGILTGIFIISQLAFKDNTKNNNHASQSSIGQFNLPKVPDTMSFAGEGVPLTRWEVREAFDRELIYNHGFPAHISYILKLSKRFFPVIEAELKKNGIPDDFKYLCVAESNLQNATSRVGATGFWQFMSYTGPGFNLQINNNIDDRYDVIKSTDAACIYFKQAYAKFGSWTAAAASYNCGQGAYNQQSTFQQTKNYYDLQLPDETNKYIFRILTFKYLISNAKEMGYIVTDENGYAPYNTKSVTISSTIPNLAAWALNNKTTYKMLKLLNPWMRGRSLVVKPGKSYVVKLEQ